MLKYKIRSTCKKNFALSPSICWATTSVVPENIHTHVPLPEVFWLAPLPSKNSSLALNFGFECFYSQSEL